MEKGCLQVGTAFFLMPIGLVMTLHYLFIAVLAAVAYLVIVFFGGFYLTRTIGKAIGVTDLGNGLLYLLGRGLALV
jgi:hypothetical protein